MKIDEIRIYSEVLEQGLDFKDYILKLQKDIPITNIYSKKIRGEFSDEDTIVDRLRKVKDIDVLITAICDEKEYPLLMVEYSTAVPVDDHKLQRADVLFWSAIYKTPMMKIYPISKGMKHNFGGGKKFTEELEIAMACRMNGIFYPIHWENEEGKDALKVKNDRLSCIYDSNDIRVIFTRIIQLFNKIDNFEEYFEILSSEYIKQNDKIIENYDIPKIKSLFANSTRYHWFGKKLRVKINRFGHAMDPERGALHFVNMLIGPSNLIAEIQVNRDPKYESRGGYKSLFDGLGCKNELKDYVQKLIEKGNRFTDENAIHIFKTALNIGDFLTFTKVKEHQYIINDDVLKNFLIKHPSRTSKSIFYLATELRLTDKDRNIICSICWNEKPIKEFIKNSSVRNLAPQKILQLSTNQAKEDIITFASVELYKRIHCSLLAVSYSGAQGDRCVLTGKGRTVLRTYVDIIAYKDSRNGIKVYLEECKDLFTKSKDDVEKLCGFKKSEEKQNGLKQLFKKTISVDRFSNIYVSVAAKETQSLPNFDVDYIFMFSIDESCNNATKIDYTVAIVDTNLLQDFSKLQNEQGKLKGSIVLDKIYYIE